MADFRIFMIGLICHITAGSDPELKQYAAIIDAEHHTAPRICVRADSVYQGDGSNIMIRLNKNDQVTFGGLPDGEAKADLSFQEMIPGLQRITDGGKLHKDVRPDKRHPDVRAYIEYKKGNLSIKRVYYYTGKYVLLGTPLDSFAHCIGSVVEYKSTTNEAYVTVTVTDVTNPNAPVVREEFKVKAGGEMCILNDSTPGHDEDHDKHHLDHHRRLTYAPLIARVVQTNNQCHVSGSVPLCACQNPDSASGTADPDLGDPECSNSQWP